MDEFAQFIEMYLQVVQASANELSDEEAQSIEAFIIEAMRFLAKQKEAPIGGPGLPPEAPEVPPGDHQSSNIEGLKYNPANKEMLIQFHGPYPQAKGPIYSYQNVPAYIYDVVSRGAVGPKTTGANRYHAWQKGITPSLGASVYALIKNGAFQYQRVA